ncbi:atp phosphoribosyltransferase [Lasius niger]|uniref:Atp phosphoribosyltransferase n=1 Tax=Lasius niger TaxID=67767 RepID=A0A0J7KTS6_LASNI|nr:atp phosphoribosyltransferase [Lasius niger]
MTWICENYIPRWIEGARCVTIYRDTDGAMFFVNKPIPHNDILRKVNRLLGSSESLGSIMLELEDSDCRLCSIMSRKKYWKVIGGEEDGGGKGVAMSYITKGFEKNAEPFVLYQTEHGIGDFAFNMPLNPRENDCAERQFVDRVLLSFAYSIGDRVKCVYRLNENDPTATNICLVKEFKVGRDRLNFYKSIRKFALYFVQLVEGCKFSNADESFDAILNRSYGPSKEGGEWGILMKVTGINVDPSIFQGFALFRAYLDKL